MDEPLRDGDGTRLLFTEEVAALLGWEASTVRAYQTLARRNARVNGRRGPGDFPAAKGRVRRMVRRGDGKMIGANSPVWREDVIVAFRAKHPARVRTQP